MPVQEHVTRRHKRALFRYFLEMDAASWRGSEIKHGLARVKADVPEAFALQPEQLRRQWKQFATFESVLRETSKYLITATAKMMCSSEEMAAATEYSFLHLVSFWPEGLVPAEVGRIALQIGVDGTEHVRGVAEDSSCNVLQELQQFVTEALLPEYMDVWRMLKDKETRISEAMSGELNGALDTLELEFQAKRLRVAFSGTIPEQWMSSIMGQLFGQLPQESCFQSHVREIKTNAGTTEDTDLPALLRQGSDTTIWQSLALRIFEDGLYHWYVQNLAWNGHVVFATEGPSSGGVESLAEERQGVELDPRITELYDHAMFEHSARSVEYFSTVLYVTGATQRRLCKFCLRNGHSVLANLLETLRLTSEQAVVEYSADALLKLQQREIVATALIIPVPQLLRIFLSLEAVIHEIADNEKYAGIFGNHLWKVLHAVAVPFVQDISDFIQDIHRDRHGDAVDDEVMRQVAELAIRYYLLSVRTKDKSFILNFSTALDGTEKLSFRNQVAARLLSEPITEDEHNIV